MEQFKKELKTLLERYKVGLGVEIEGDTHGIDSQSFVIVDTNFKIIEVIAEYDSFIFTGDL